MAAVQVTCISKIKNTREGITHVGGPADGGWRWPIEKVIDAIDNETHTFFTLVGGKRAEVEPYTGPSGKRHLRTNPDDTESDNLLSLPSCTSP